MAYFATLMVSATPAVIESPSGDNKNIFQLHFDLCLKMHVMHWIKNEME